MPRFSSAKKQGIKQAAAVMRKLQGKYIKSVGTARNYEQALRIIATQLALSNKNLKDLTPKGAQQYLKSRACKVGQSALNMERQAIQSMMQHITHQLSAGITLPVTKSHKKQHTGNLGRAYTPGQVSMIVKHQSPPNALATQIAYSAGLRAHELLTISLKNQRPADTRPAEEEKFLGRQEANYTVIGKGGLIREISIPQQLAIQLEQHALSSPAHVIDRGINYNKQYNIGAGNAWSTSFSRASNSTLGWSTGAHGVRHSYGQERMDELRSSGLTREHALLVVSQEMGHFRPEITEVYLR